MVMKINMLGITGVEFLGQSVSQNFRGWETNPSACIYHLQTRWLWKGMRVLKDILPLQKHVAVMQDS